ncbi:MAG: hypothetical protein CSB34_07485 [Desulfobulbus propionicus]|nr:MAG: hypothetical protein CSB34_07485 [Desulfobulbus propionicus]
MNMQQSLYQTVSFFFVLLLTLLSDQAQAELTIPLHVEQGTNLIHLARDYCHTRQDWKTIARVNKLKPPYLIIEQTELLVPLSLLKVTALQAQIASVHGDVTKSTSKGTFLQVKKGTTLRTGDTLKTSRDSFAHVIFPDHRYLRLEPRSTLTIDYMVKLSDDKIKIGYTLNSGRVLNTLLESLQPNDSHIIRTPTAITGVRGTEYRIKVENAQQSTVETLNGKVRVAAAGKAITLHKNQGTRVQEGAPPAPPKVLLAPPEDLPTKDYYRTLPAVIPAPAYDRAKQLRLRITGDDKGINTIKELYAAPDTNFILDRVEDGTYFSFLTALDKEGFEGAPSGPHPFRVRTTPSAPLIATPANDFISWDQQVEIGWLKEEQARQFHYQLATDREFTTVIAEDTLSQPGLTTTKLVPGQYFFRVQAIAEDEFESLYSPVIAFKVVKQLELGDMAVSAEELTALQWEAMSAQCTYDLQVADDKNFTEILIETNGLKQPSYTLKKHLIPGEYYVRIRGVMGQGKKQSIGPWTSPQKLTIERGPLSWQEVVVGMVFVAIILL